MKDIIEKIITKLMNIKDDILFSYNGIPLRHLEPSPINKNDVFKHCVFDSYCHAKLYEIKYIDPINNKVEVVLVDDILIYHDFYCISNKVYEIIFSHEQLEAWKLEESIINEYMNKKCYTRIDYTNKVFINKNNIISITELKDREVIDYDRIENNMNWYEELQLMIEKE